MSHLPRDLAVILRLRIHSSTSGRIRELTIQVDASVVLLHGTCPNFHVKQLALRAVRGVLPHATVHNRIQVELAAAE